MKTLISLLLMLLLLSECTQTSDKTEDILELFVLNEYFNNNVNLKLNKVTSGSTRATISELQELPIRFQDGLPTIVVPAKNIRMEILRVFLWKSEEFGGVAKGKETIQNANAIVVDYSNVIAGANAAGGSGKQGAGVFEGNMLRGGFGINDSNTMVGVYYPSKEWQDPTYDRIGLEITDISIELDMTHLSSKMNRLISLEFKGMGKPSVFPAIRDYNQWVPVPVNYVRAYPSKQNSGTDTPCPGGIPTGPPQIIACTGNPNLRYYIDKRTGGPSIANNEYFSLYANSISNVPNFSQTEYDSFKSSGLPYPRIPSSVLSNQVTWEIPANSKEYETPIWKAERVVLLELPKAAGRRNKVDFNLDATKTFVFQTSSTGSKFEMNEIPKFNFQNEPGDAGGFNNLDSAWLFSDYSTWSYAPKNGNQPDPANGRDFGYFLPKFSVTAE